MPTTTVLSTPDLLFLVSSMSILVLAILFSVLVIQLILILKDFRKMSRTAGDVTEKFHGMILTPVNYLTKITEGLAPHLEDFIKKQFDKKSSKKK